LLLFGELFEQVYLAVLNQHPGAGNSRGITVLPIDSSSNSWPFPEEYYYS
jgi:hypothetical protein